MPASRQACGVSRPLATSTSTCSQQGHNLLRLVPLPCHTSAPSNVALELFSYHSSPARRHPPLEATRSSTGRGLSASSNLNSYPTIPLLGREPISHFLKHRKARISTRRSSQSNRLAK